MKEVGKIVASAGLFSPEMVLDRDILFSIYEQEHDEKTMHRVLKCIYRGTEYCTDTVMVPSNNKKLLDMDLKYALVKIVKEHESL